MCVPLMHLLWLVSGWSTASEAIGEHRLYDTSVPLTINNERLGELRRSKSIKVHPLFAEVVTDNAESIVTVADLALIELRTATRANASRGITSTVPIPDEILLAHGAGSPGDLRSSSEFNFVS